MSQVQQSDMDALAQAANDVLLPVVNAIAISGSYMTWYSNIYDVDSLNMPGTSDPIPVVYQPPYSFSQSTFSNIIPSSSVFDGSGKYTFSITTTGFYFVLIDNSETINTNANAWIAPMYGYDLECRKSGRLYLIAGNSIIINGTSGASVKSKISSFNSWLYELNRIRGDLMSVLTGGRSGWGQGSLSQYGFWNQTPNLSFGTPLYLSQQAVCSGPWIVYINDARKYDNGIYNGIFYNTFAGKTLGQTYWFKAFRNLAFYTGDNQVRIQTCLGDGVTSSVFTFTTSNTGQQYTSLLSFITNNTGILSASITCQIAVSGSITIPASSGTVFPTALPAPSQMHVTTTIGAVTIGNPSALTYTINTYTDGGILKKDFVYSGTYDVAISVSNYPMTGTANLILAYFVANDFFGIGDPTGLYSSSASAPNASIIVRFVTQTSSAGTPFLNAIRSGGAAYRVAAIEDDTTTFTVNGSAPAPCFILTNALAGGLWEANTLPVPGQNVFLDQDFYTYVSSFINNALPDYSSGTTTSESYGDSKINTVTPVTTPKPTKWPTVRDSDMIPLLQGNIEWQAVIAETGFNATLSRTVIVFPKSTTTIAFRAYGMSWKDVGWKNGLPIIGVDNLSGITIYVGRSPTINPTNPSTYDFSVSGTTVTIPGNCPAGYEILAESAGSIYFIATAPTTGVISRFSNSQTIKRTFFPEFYGPHPTTNLESFSYDVLGDSIPLYNYYKVFQSGTGYASQREVPGCGYCIFKVKATRLPVDNGFGIAVTPQSGADLTITLGQYVTDNSNPANLYFEPFKSDNGLDNLTIEIPATAGESGEVAVYLPVLSGNELVYQCSQQVILDAWVNWQPIWFSSIFGSHGFSTGTEPTMFSHQHCLGFVNFNWNNSAKISSVQYPLARCIFDDIISLMRVINPNYNYPTIGVGNDSWNPQNSL